MDLRSNQNKISIKYLLLFIGIALLAGVIGAFLGGDMKDFEAVAKPSFSPPGFLFPIVWTILYILMGISSYLVCVNKTDKKFVDKACKLYYLQLIVNVLWTPIFFRFKLYFLAFIWVLLLIFLVIYMIVKFYKIKPVAGLLQVPYLLWLIFASILNFSIFMMNK